MPTAFRCPICSQSKDGCYLDMGELSIINSFGKTETYQRIFQLGQVCTECSEKIKKNIKEFISIFSTVSPEVFYPKQPLAKELASKDRKRAVLSTFKNSMKGRIIPEIARVMSGKYKREMGISDDELAGIKFSESAQVIFDRMVNNYISAEWEGLPVAEIERTEVRSGSTSNTDPNVAYYEPPEEQQEMEEDEEEIF